MMEHRRSTASVGGSGAYLFPDDGIVELDDQALLDLIERNIGDALAAPDGSDFNSDVRIDVSQDFIEQARDLLVSRGHVFSAEDQERMPFLRWPLSEEQRAAQAEAEAEESAMKDAARVRCSAYCAAMKTFVHAMLAGESVEPPPPHWYLRIGDSRAGTREGLSGADVLQLIAEFEIYTGASAHLYGYGCSRVGVTFETDPAPAWSIRVPLTADAGVWRYLKRWMVTLPKRTWAEAWDMRDEAADPLYVRPHVDVTQFFPRGVDVLADPLEQPRSRQQQMIDWVNSHHTK